MKKRMIALMMMLALVLCLAACGGGDSEPAEAAPEDTAAEETADTGDEEEPAAASEDIVVDEEAGTVTITAQINGTFFDQSTMHCIVFKDGGAGDKAMMAAYCDSQDFFDAMMQAGGKPWNTTDQKLEDGEYADGQKVEVTFKWDGQETPVSLTDAVKTDEGKLDIDERFSGNQQGNKEAGSGCICCLNSCWAGICTNVAYPYGAIDAGNPHAYLDDSVMPEDGTDVQVTFTLQ